MLDGTALTGDAACTANGKLSLKATNGETKELDWNRVRLARFVVPGPKLNPLPKGWIVEDIGKVTGMSFEQDAGFTLTVPSAEVKEGKYQACHYAHRMVRGDPVVVARVISMHGAKPSVGGVLLRDNMETAGAFALVGVTGDNHLRFDTREGSWGNLKTQDLGPVPLPIWLKIVRQEKENSVIAYRSPDGKTWVQIGQSKLNCHNEAFPENSDQWKPRLYAGIGITAATNGVTATLRCDSASISTFGWFGEYYYDASFKKLAFVRPDRHLEFWWGDQSPVQFWSQRTFRFAGVDSWSPDIRNPIGSTTMRMGVAC